MVEGRKPAEGEIPENLHRPAAEGRIEPRIEKGTDEPKDLGRTPSKFYEAACQGMEDQAGSGGFKRLSTELKVLKDGFLEIEHGVENCLGSFLKHKPDPKDKGKPEDTQRAELKPETGKPKLIGMADALATAPLHAVQNPDYVQPHKVKTITISGPPPEASFSPGFQPGPAFTGSADSANVRVEIVKVKAVDAAQALGGKSDAPVDGPCTVPAGGLQPINFEQFKASMNLSSNTTSQRQTDQAQDPCKVGPAGLQPLSFDQFRASLENPRTQTQRTADQQQQQDPCKVGPAGLQPLSFEQFRASIDQNTQRQPDQQQRNNMDRVAFDPTPIERQRVPLGNPDQAQVRTDLGTQASTSARQVIDPCTVPAEGLPKFTTASIRAALNGDGPILNPNPPNPNAPANERTGPAPVGSQPGTGVDLLSSLPTQPNPRVASRELASTENRTPLHASAGAERIGERGPVLGVGPASPAAPGSNNSDASGRYTASADVGRSGTRSDVSSGRVADGSGRALDFSSVAASRNLSISDYPSSKTVSVDPLITSRTAELQPKIVASNEVTPTALGHSKGELPSDQKIEPARVAEQLVQKQIAEKQAETLAQVQKQIEAKQLEREAQFVPRQVAAAAPAVPENANPARGTAFEMAFGSISLARVSGQGSQAVSLESLGAAVKNGAAEKSGIPSGSADGIISGPVSLSTLRAAAFSDTGILGTASPRSLASAEALTTAAANAQAAAGNAALTGRAGLLVDTANPLVSGKGIFAVDPLATSSKIIAFDSAAGKFVNAAISPTSLGSAPIAGSIPVRSGFDGVISAQVFGNDPNLAAGLRVSGRIDPVTGRPGISEAETKAEFDLVEFTRIQKALGGRRYLTGVEIALAMAIASAAVAKARDPKQQDGQGELAADDLKLLLDEARNDNDDGITKIKTANTVKRPVYMIAHNDSLVEIAERIFNNTDVAWLIADINAGRISEHSEDGKRIIELRSRQEIELPLQSEVEEFLLAKNKAAKAENLVTIVGVSEIDRELLDSFLSTVVGGTAAEPAKGNVAAPVLAAETAVMPAPAPQPLMQLLSFGKSFGQRLMPSMNAIRNQGLNLKTYISKIDNIIPTGHAVITSLSPEPQSH